jgi:DNA-binding MarR family transcriptional regulator
MGFKYFSLNIPIIYRILHSQEYFSLDLYSWECKYGIISADFNHNPDFFIERILVLIGIINQLSTTRLNRVLAELDLPLAQFQLLIHFSHDPKKGWTVTRLAEVMEMNQPAMTKTTQRLLKKGFLQTVQEHADKRVKSLYVTDAGLQTLGVAWEKLAPDIARFASAWSNEDLDRLRELLERLKEQLDEARD